MAASLSTSDKCTEDMTRPTRLTVHGGCEAVEAVEMHAQLGAHIGLNHKGNDST